MFKQRLMLSLVLSLMLLAPGIRSAQPATAQTSPAPEANARSALFIENAGQWPPSTSSGQAHRFQVWGSPLGTGTTWLAEDAIWLVAGGGERESWSTGDKESFSPSPSRPLPPSPQIALKLTFPGSNPDVRIEPFDPLTTTVSYFMGNDPEKWHSDVPVWGGVRYADLYPGVDLVIGGGKGDWRFEATPGAATGQVRLLVEGAAYSRIESHELRLSADSGQWSIALPAAAFSYRVSVARGDGQSLLLTAPAGQPLPRAAEPEDDPSDVLYGTFLGGESLEWPSAIAADDTEHAYVTGTTHSYDFPSTPGAFDPSNNGDDEVFVAKFTPNGDAMVYATFLGGWDYEWSSDISVDESGRATVVGRTVSFDFPTTPGAFDTSHNSPSSFDTFIARLSSDGSTLEYSTFLGGSAADEGVAVALDDTGNVYVTGYTWSGDFPTTPGAFSTVHAGIVDVFVAKLNQSGTALEYSTYLGGSEGGHGADIAVDSLGNSYVTGYTLSSDFPTTADAFDRSFNGRADAFVSKLNPTGSDLVYSTYLGGDQSDSGAAIAVDDDFAAYVTGDSESRDFPTTPGSIGEVHNGGTTDAFVVKLDPTGSNLDYGVFLGGNRVDVGDDILLNTAGDAYVVGTTNSLDFPTTPWAFDTSYNDGFDAFVVILNAAGEALEYASFLGGNAEDTGRTLAISESGRVFIAGETRSHNFPVTPGAYDTSHDIWVDVYVVKMDLSPYVSMVVAPIERPAASAVVSGIVTVSGFAVDLASPGGTGIDKVSIYLDGPYGAGALVGNAAYGITRPDVAAQYGVRFAPSGWTFSWNTFAVPAGDHQLVIYAHRTTDGSWTTPRFQPVIVASAHGGWLPLLLRNR